MYLASNSEGLTQTDFWKAFEHLRSGAADSIETQSTISIPNSMLASRKISRAANSIVRVTQSQKILQKVKVSLPHIALVFGTIVYSVLGAIVFYLLEHGAELSAKERAIDDLATLQQQEFRKLYEFGNYWSTSRKDFDAAANAALDRIFAVTFQNFQQKHMQASELSTNTTTSTWDGYQAVFFSVITMTTIGYGNTVPRTKYGRLFSVVFAMFGIPLMIVTTADIGRFVSDFLLTCVTALRRKAKAARSRVRRASRLSASRVAQSVPHVPSAAVGFVILAYITYGAAMFHITTDYSVLESVYYLAITVTTIGYGDYVPKFNESFVEFITATLYIVLGLVLCTMSIDLVGSRMIHSVHYFGSRLQDVRALLGTAVGSLSDQMSHMRFVQKRYGLTDEQMANMMTELTVAQAEEVLRPTPIHTNRSLHAYRPSDLDMISFIDRRSTTCSASIASVRLRFAELEEILESAEATDRFALSIRTARITDRLTIPMSSRRSRNSLGLNSIY